MDRIKIGSHLAVIKKGYGHHGIYIGRGKVVHYSGPATGLRDGPVEITTLELFNSGRDFYVFEYEDPKYLGKEAAERAKNKVGKNLYKSRGSDCEEFCTWVIRGTWNTKEKQDNNLPLNPASAWPFSALDNASIKKTLKPGAHIFVDKGLYTHHGIYIGRGEVIHYSGLADGLLSQAGCIEKISLDEFAGEQSIQVKKYESPAFSGKDIVIRAKSRLNEDDYSIFTNNCEHFCSWAVTGDHKSEQMEKWKGRAKTTAGIAAGVMLPPPVRLAAGAFYLVKRLAK